ncbi:hypothetical protein GF314_08685 [bacterium]|nr:hypothetical protein [bacterium]
MAHSLLFVDLAGTLVLRDPQSRQWVAWTGVAGLLHGLAQGHDLHLTTGDDDASARAALEELEVTEYFTGVHAGLPGGGKPFGQLARVLGAAPEQCLAIGDNPVSDTAGDTERVVSVILRHETAQVPVQRVREVVGGLQHVEGYLTGFAATLERAGGVATTGEPGPLDPSVLSVCLSGSDCRLGWWQKSTRARRPVVVVAA